VSSEIDFVATYSCPHCRADLETGFDAWQGWQRCPRCGLACLPPEPPGLRSARKPGTRPKVADDVLALSDSPDMLADAEAVAPVFGGRPSHIGPARLVFRTGLLVSLGLMLIFYLDRNTMNAAIFGCLAVVFFLLLLRTAGSRSPAP
jgi:hypothetical protein